MKAPGHVSGERYMSLVLSLLVELVAGLYLLTSDTYLSPPGNSLHWWGLLVYSVFNVVLLLLVLIGPWKATNLFAGIWGRNRGCRDIRRRRFKSCSEFLLRGSTLFWMGLPLRFREDPGFGLCVLYVSFRDDSACVFGSECNNRLRQPDGHPPCGQWQRLTVVQRAVRLSTLLSSSFLTRATTSLDVASISFTSARAEWE